MSDRFRIRTFWLAANVWAVVWVVQLVRFTFLSDPIYTGLMAFIAIVTFGLFLLATEWSKAAREDAKAERVAARH